jgi:hypothetical protein
MMLMHQPQNVIVGLFGFHFKLIDQIGSFKLSIRTFLDLPA